MGFGLNAGKKRVKRRSVVLATRENALAAADEEAEIDPSRLRAEIVSLRSRVEDAEKERDRITRHLVTGSRDFSAACICGNVFMADSRFCRWCGLPRTQHGH